MTRSRDRRLVEHLALGAAFAVILGVTLFARPDALQGAPSGGPGVSSPSLASPGLASPGLADPLFVTAGR